MVSEWRVVHVVLPLGLDVGPELLLVCFLAKRVDVVLPGSSAGKSGFLLQGKILRPDTLRVTVFHFPVPLLLLSAQSQSSRGDPRLSGI